MGTPEFGSWNQNPALAEDYTSFFQLQREKRSSRHNITGPKSPRLLSQRKLHELSQNLDPNPNSGFTEADESMLAIANTKELITIPYEPHVNRDTSTSQETRSAPQLDISEPLPPKPSSQHNIQGSSGRSPNWAQLDAGNTGYKKLKELVCDVMFCKKNFAVLQTKIQLLREEVAEVQSLPMTGVYDCMDEVQHWLLEASEVLKEANGILDNMDVKKHLCGPCWDPTFLWGSGELLRDVDKILEQRKGLDLSSYLCDMSYSNKLESRENTLHDILNALTDNQINMIGIYGMIGVGKSVLAKELVRRAQDNQLFDTILMVQVSESLDVNLIQTQIANKIGLQLLEEDVQETRAHILYSKLKEMVTETVEENEPNRTPQAKILVIFDGIQHVIDMMKVGIPVKGSSRCKVVLLSRNADVCREMGSEKYFPVECLNLDEAEILFRESLIDKMPNMEITLEKYLYMESVVLKKCGGLPLMINSLKCALRSLSWCNWEILVDQISRHSLLEVDVVKEVPSAILELCNHFIQKGDKHKRFLLCCLIHGQGADVPLEKLKRYGISFGLFEDESLSAIDSQINLWVHQLKTLSLLLDTKTDMQHVKIHDIVQNVGISALSQGNDILPVLLDVGNCWHTRESYENCIAISMMSDSNYKCLNGLELHKLQALLLKDIHSLSLQGNFFRGMQDLKVLEISGTKFAELPASIRGLKNLVTLHLEYCDFEGEIISMISELNKLQVLSLRGSSIQILSEEIGKLTNLRVLDLNNCKYLVTFPVDAAVKMVRLKELYLYDSYIEWNSVDTKKLSRLPLEVLEITVHHHMSSRLNLNFVNLRRFRISVGGEYGDLEYISCFSRVILIKYHSCAEVVESGLTDLLPETEYLRIEGVTGLSNSIAELFSHVFLNLKSVYIANCQMKCVLDTSRNAFPELEILTLVNLSTLTSICCWESRHTLFPQLRELRLTELEQLHPFVLPAQFAVQLRVMEVSSCGSLLYIFPTDINNDTDGTDLSLELPFLEKLELHRLTCIKSLQQPLEDSIKRDNCGLLFNGKIKLPSLREMHLFGLDQIDKLWDLWGPKEHADGVSTASYGTLQTQPYWKSCCFGNLASMRVSHCYGLKSLFTSTVLNSLLQLETLIVEHCYKMKEVISCSTDIEDNASPTTMLTFPRLKVLRLDSLGSLECFYRGCHWVKFPMLKNLHLISLEEMKAFALPITQSVETGDEALFDGEIDFPSLEHLEILEMHCIKLLHRHNETTKFSHLSRLTLTRLPSLRALPTIHSKNLRFMNLQELDSCNVLFSVEPQCMPSGLSELYSIEEELVDDEKSVEKWFLSLKELELHKLIQLKMIRWNTLPCLTSLIISELHSWTSLITNRMLVGGAVLPLLEYIQITDCSGLETIVSGEELQEEDEDFFKYGITLFPSLKKIQLSSLPRLGSFRMGGYEAHFPSLEKLDVEGCPSFQSFSMGTPRTPRLNSVIVDSKTMEADHYECINSAVAAGLKFSYISRTPRLNSVVVDSRTMEADQYECLNSAVAAVDSGSSFGVTSSSDRILGSPMRYPPQSPLKFPPPSKLGPVQLSFNQAVKATQNFSSSSCIGEGRFGTVYKGRLPDGREVAIKRARKDHFDSTEFNSEVDILSKIDHRNLVRLLGCVDRGNERLIVTEYVSNGTLRQHLDGERGRILDFNQRLEISIDIAHGLTYLHIYADQQIIHRDVKSSNILVSEGMRAKVADFGFARVGPRDADSTHISTKVKGTVGYIDPEYMRTYQLTTKSDVYSFGILLLEILTGRRPLDLRRPPYERVLIKWAFYNYSEGNIVGIVDPQMQESVNEDILRKMFSLAIECAALIPTYRPDMRSVGERLWAIRMDYKARKG